VTFHFRAESVDIYCVGLNNYSVDIL